MSPHDHPPEWRPTDDVLAAFAAGQLDLAQRVLLEAHLAFDPHSSAQVGQLLEPGGSWLREMPEAAVPDPLWDRLSVAIDEQPEQASPLSETPLPAAAWAELPAMPEALQWFPVHTSKGRATRLWADPETRIDLLLVQMPGGHILPRHEHLGSEELVVIQGGYTDEVGHFDVGDYIRHPTGSVHRPLTDPDEPCWIVLRIENGIRFLE